MNSIHPHNDEILPEPRRPWSYWARQQADTLRVALGCDDQEWEELERRTMKEKPILFSGPMVRAILEGRKTQTRRIIKPQPTGSPYWTEHENSGCFFPANIHSTPTHLKCPWSIGMTLWVRENLYKKNGYAFYAADNEQILIGGPGINEGVLWEWKKNYLPSIHMPRWASRIILEVTGIWVERVQEITEKDARAEGVSPFTKSPWDAGDCWTDGKYRTAFEYEWNEIFGWSPNAWARNDWVWGVEFKRVKP